MDIECYFSRGATKQLAESQWGALNFVRPETLDFSQANKTADAGNNLAQDKSNVLGVSSAANTPEEKVKNSIAFSLKMLLPYSLGGMVVNPTGPAQYPTPTPLPGGFPTSTPTPNPSRPACSEGSGYCAVTYLSNYFPNETSARIASKICQRESGSDPFVPPNTACLSGISADYSVGLFQINLLYHCAADAFSFTLDPPFCTILEGKKEEIIDPCVYQLGSKDNPDSPNNNIRKALELSQNGTYWRHWYSDRGCDIFK